MPLLAAPLTSSGAALTLAVLCAVPGAAHSQAVQPAAEGLATSAVSLQRAPVILESIAELESAGNVETAWDLEQELLTEARRHTADLRTVPILREIARKRLGMLEAYLAGEAPLQVVLGCYYNWSRNRNFGGCNAGSRRDAARAILADALRNYADAVAVILRNERYSSLELRTLEMQLVRSSDLIRYYNDIYDQDLDSTPMPPFEHDDAQPWRGMMEALVRLAHWMPEGSRAWSALEQAGRRQARFNRIESYYRLGRLSLERLFAYEVETEASLPARADAMIRIADWDLLYSHNSLALDGYERAYGMLERAGVARASIDEIFSAGTPVVLPTFSPSPLLSAGPNVSSRYMDVAFEITKYGESRQVDLVDKSATVTDAEADALVRSIKRARFRPAAIRGRFSRTPPISVRYHLRQ